MSPTSRLLLLRLPWTAMMALLLLLLLLHH
jgi:hypothetical protein